MRKRKKKTPPNDSQLLTLVTPDGEATTVHDEPGPPDGCFMEPNGTTDRPVGSWTDAQLGSYVRQTIARGDVGLLLFVCHGQTWARRVAPPSA